MISNSTAITLEDLAIESGPESAVRISNARHVTVRRCLIQMRDRPTIWQAIYSRGDDILIDSNIIEVLPREGGPPASQLPPAIGESNAPFGVHTPPDPINVGFATRGGIQLAGGSDRVEIIKNIIRGGIWNGITLGSLHLVGSNDPDTPDTPGSEDPCDPCRPPDLSDDGVGDPDNPDVRFESAGDLYDIKIAGNQITDMGINGIGVVRFFNLANKGDMIGVHGLHITDNYISRCMRRSLVQVKETMSLLVAYGGIALAKVTDLRILRNEIVHNGVSHLQPICGVFGIIVQGLQLDDNRILDNGPKTREPAGNAQKGIRGGVHVWIVMPVMGPAPTDKFLAANKIQTRSGVTTVAMRDNVIDAPLGRAVTFFALGPVVVARNRLVTQGYTQSGLDVFASTILIGNFGLSNEWTIGLLQILVLILLGKLEGSKACALAKKNGLFDQGSLQPPLVRRLSTGKTLFTENQVTLNVTDQPTGFCISSQVIFSLDDVGFTDNQCEVSTTAVFFLLNAFLLGGSVRESDNRLSETWLRTKLSSWSIGLMNTTTDNQTTHCIKANALPNTLLLKDNLFLIHAFCPGECEKLIQ